MQISSEKAISSGFEFTPVELTIDDTISWIEETRKPGDALSGLARSKELELIEKLKGMNANKPT
ncbi:MAG: hypothetical protein OEM82_01695 [Acidobacteriota bacterium]|nr:hypothetical protein [Acidobacteriota bacterium]MDH3528859.1 hypothetical protein [Acidobacteriota bacterium]